MRNNILAERCVLCCQQGKNIYFMYYINDNLYIAAWPPLHNVPACFQFVFNDVTLVRRTRRSIYRSYKALAFECNADYANFITSALYVKTKFDNTRI